MSLLQPEDMDRLKTMEVFVAAVELGSLTAAANHLRITPAVVSRHVSSLERRLGASLLNRTTRKQNLTEFGKTYFEKCKNILHQISELEAGAEALSTTPKGLLRVSAPILFGVSTLAPVIGEYLNRYPDVNLQLNLSDRFVDLVEERFDVAIRVGDLDDSSLVARKLTKFEVAICASPDYIFRSGCPKTPDDLVKHQCLGLTNWSTHGGWKVFYKNSGVKSNICPRVESNNARALLEIALKGVGIVMMQKELLWPEIKSGRLIQLMENHTPSPKFIHAVYPKSKVSVRKVGAFVDFLVKNFSKPLELNLR